MHIIIGWTMDAKIWTVCKCRINLFHIGKAFCSPFRHFFQLETSDHTLHFHHAPVGTKGVMQPAETRWMLFVIDAVKVFAMIFIGPHFFPQGFVIGGDHTAFTACSHNLVLTEGPGTNMTD